LSNPSAERKLIMILLSDEEWDISDLKNAFGNGLTSRDNVISKVHEIYDQVHFVCVRKAKKVYFYCTVGLVTQCFFSQ